MPTDVSVRTTARGLQIWRHDMDVEVRKTEWLSPLFRIQFQFAIKGEDMQKLVARSGKVGYIILWLLGIPIPILLLIYALRGCN